MDEEVLTKVRELCRNARMLLREAEELERFVASKTITDKKR